jgi:hypothetical protein
VSYEEKSLIALAPDRVVVVAVVVGDVQLLRAAGLAVRAAVDLPQGLVQLKINTWNDTFDKYTKKF